MLTNAAIEALTYDCTITDHCGIPLCSIKSIEVDAHGKPSLIVERRYELGSHRLDISPVELAENYSHRTDSVPAEEEGMV